jgi:hypothetical protein
MRPPKNLLGDEVNVSFGSDHDFPSNQIYGGLLISLYSMGADEDGKPAIDRSP